MPRLADVVVVVVVGLGVVILVSLEGNHLLLAIPVGLLVVACGWLFLKERLELALGLVCVYLGLLDGYLKLRTGQAAVTLIRDALLYSVVLGALARIVIRGQSLPAIPRAPLVLAFAATVVLQLANPSDPKPTQTLGGLRPELEWLPLFFFGWTLMRSVQRLRAFCMLLLVIGAINGVVTFIQFNLTPGQFASWGPGYAQLVSGQNSYGAPAAGRSFVDQSGRAHTRPFGLGSDAGFPGFLAFLVVPTCLALLMLHRHRRRMLLVVALSIGVLLLVAASQGRAGVVGTLVAVAAFCLLAGDWQHAIRIVGSLVVIVAVGAVVGSFVSQHSKSGAFDRWKTLAPNHIIQAFTSNKGHSFTLIPKYAVSYPLGAGLGRGGATTFLAGQQTLSNQSSGALLDSETEFTFLEHDVGLPGLIAMVALALTMVVDGVKLVRTTENSELRLLLAALVAALIATLAQWITAPPTAVMPTAPFFWFAGGTIAWWLASRRRLPGADPRPPPAVLAVPQQS